MKYQKNDKIIQDLLEVNTNFLILSDEKLIQYIDYLIADEQLFMLFKQNKVKKTDGVEKLVLTHLAEFLDNLKIHFHDTKDKNPINGYKELDCDEFITFVNNLIFH